MQPPRQPHVSSHFVHECCLKILFGKFYINLQSGSNDRHHFVSGPGAHPFCQLGSDRAVLAELGLFSVPFMDQLHSNSLDHTAHPPHVAVSKPRSGQSGDNCDKEGRSSQHGKARAMACTASIFDSVHVKVTNLFLWSNLTSLVHRFASSIPLIISGHRARRGLRPSVPW